MLKVLLTDGNFKHTLAAVRSLGRRGARVEVLEKGRWSVSSLSRYCAGQVKAPDPRDGEAFSRFLADLVARRPYDVLIPVSYASVVQASAARDLIMPKVRMVLPDPGALAIAGHKGRTAELAAELGIPVPRTFQPGSDRDLEEIARTAVFPLVVKGATDAGNLGYARNPGELKSLYRSLAPFDPLVQEYIPGEGYGFFALYNRGSARAVFMHRRIREYPVTGGPSSLAESIRDPVLSELGTRLLDRLGWHGPAMVEFKKDRRDGRYVLVEINPKLWGSLDLAIASGVDFPWLICRMAMDGDIEPVTEYRTGVKFRWVFPEDLFHALTGPGFTGRFLKDFFDPGIRSDIVPGDLLPTVARVGMTGGELVIRIWRGRFWRPHGTPDR